MDKREITELENIIHNAIRKDLLEMRVSLPVKVETYDAALQKVNVKPLLKRKYFLDTGQEIVSEMAVIPDVPVHFPSSDNNNAFFTFPIKKDDRGYVLFCDRSLELWLSGSGGIVDPNDDRIHNISDAIFVPGLNPFGSPLAGVSADNIVLKYNNLSFSITPNNKISISNGTDDFVDLVKQLCEALTDMKIITALGPKPPVNLTTFQSLLTKFTGFVV